MESRPQNRSWPFPSLCDQLHFVSPLSPRLERAGGLAPDILIMRRKWEERKPWKEISLQMPPSSPPPPPLLPPPCPRSNPSPSVFPGSVRTQPGSWTVFKPEASGHHNVCLWEGGPFPCYEPESNWQPCWRDAEGTSQSLKNLSARGPAWKPAPGRTSIITHIVLTGPFTRETIRQSSMWHTRRLGKICWLLRLSGRSVNHNPENFNNPSFVTQTKTR